MHAIYILVDPRRPEDVRYVGVTKQPMNQRLCCHIGTARKGCAWPISRWIRKLERAGIRPEMRKIEETTDRLREKYWIKYYLAQGAGLLNCSEATGTEVVWSAEMREKIGAAHRGRKRPPGTGEKISASRKRHDATYGHKGGPRPGVPASDETRRKRAASGYSHSAETRTRISAAQKGKKHPPRKPAETCHKGHSLSGDNLRVGPQGKRSCRACKAEWAREKYRKEHPGCPTRKTKRQ